MKKIRLKMAKKKMETLFFHYNYMGIFHHSRACNSETCDWILLKLEPGRDLMNAIVTRRYEEDLNKNGRKKWRHLSAISLKGTKSMGDWSNPCTWSLVEIGWLMSDIFLLQSVNDDGPWLYYNLTFRAFGSGELKWKGHDYAFCRLIYMLLAAYA